MNNREAKEVQVAKITARQAVTVAIISAVAGILGTLIGTGALKTGGTAAPKVQHYITIGRVQLQDTQLRGFRVVAIINGRAVSYPTKAVWMDAKPATESETFAIEVSESYRVSIELLGVDQRGEVSRFTSSNPQTLESRQLPMEQIYEVHGSGSETSAAGPVVARIAYKISDRTN